MGSTVGNRWSRCLDPSRADLTLVIIPPSFTVRFSLFRGRPLPSNPVTFFCTASPGPTPSLTIHSPRDTLTARRDPLPLTLKDTTSPYLASAKTYAPLPAISYARPTSLPGTQPHALVHILNSSVLCPSALSNRRPVRADDAHVRSPVASVPRPATTTVI